MSGRDGAYVVDERIQEPSDHFKGDGVVCDEHAPEGWFSCTRDRSHDGQHEAAAGITICAVWL